MTRNLWSGVEQFFSRSCSSRLVRAGGGLIAAVDYVDVKQRGPLILPRSYSAAADQSALAECVSAAAADSEKPSPACVMDKVRIKPANYDGQRITNP